MITDEELAEMSERLEGDEDAERLIAEVNRLRTLGPWPPAIADGFGAITAERDRLRAEVERLRVEVDYYKPIAQNFMGRVGPIGRVVRAARKVHNGPGHYPTHLGGCIGVLSEPSCECGIGDLSFAVMALDRSDASVRPS